MKKAGEHPIAPRHIAPMPLITPISPPKARQQFLAYRVELRLPTVDLAGARAITGLHENEIKERCECGELPAWNIAVDPASRREWRILGRAARDWADHRPATTDADFIQRLLYGPTKPYILGISFYAAWNCDSGHMINLVEDKTLELVKGTSYGQGRGCTPCITWASAIKFLKDRRIA